MTSEEIKNGVEIASEVAQSAAPIVSIYNPAAGAALSILAPIAEKFLINELGIIAIWKKDMTKEEMIKALEQSKSEFWHEPGKITAE